MSPGHRFMPVAAVAIASCWLPTMPLAADDVAPGYRVRLVGSTLLPETAAGDSGEPVRLTGASGVTWLGDDRYAAVMDNSHWLVCFRLPLAADGQPGEPEDVRLVRLGESHDYEDVAPCPAAIARRIDERRELRGQPATGRCLLVCEESGPAIRAIAIDSGELLGTVPIPERLRKPRPNRGLEALAVDPDGEVIWTANEEALPGDGPAATATTGTVVRLARIPVPPMTGTAEFAYPVDPPHDFVRVFQGEPLSGVSAVVALGAGRLLVLERSGCPGLPPFENRIFVVDTCSARDVSAVAGALADRRGEMLGKRLLWRDGLGCNLEGLCLGPQLHRGRRALVGIADNGGLGTPTQVVVFAAESPADAGVTSP